MEDCKGWKEMINALHFPMCFPKKMEEWEINLRKYLYQMLPHIETPPSCIWYLNESLNLINAGITLDTHQVYVGTKFVNITLQHVYLHDPVWPFTPIFEDLMMPYLRKNVYLIKKLFQ